MFGINLRNFLIISLVLHIVLLSLASAFLVESIEEFTRPSPIEVGIVATYTNPSERTNSLESFPKELPKPEKRVEKPVVPIKEKRETQKKKEIAKKVNEPVVEQSETNPTRNGIFESIEKVENTTVTSISEQVTEYISGHDSQKSDELAYPDYKINPKPNYPMIARRKGYEGVVLLKVWVLENGRVGKIELQKSSNYEMLDKSAMKAVENWIFIPGKKNGEPISSWVTVPVKFQLSSG
ncbi:MAG TPA: TonB family protein [Thermodesulfobacteriota bacterium]|nr:TonB family protein [Thermodesulfobacteriota bacterium]